MLYRPRSKNPNTLAPLRIALGLFVFLLSLKSHALTVQEQTLYKKAQTHIASGEYEKALLALDQIEANTAQVIYMRAQIILAQQNMEKAEAAFLELESFQGWQSIAWYYLAAIAQQRQDSQRAKRYFEKVIEADQSESLVEKSRQALARISSKDIEDSIVSAQILIEGVWDQLSEKNDVESTTTQALGSAITAVLDYQRLNHRVFSFAYDRRQDDLPSFDVTQFGLGYEYQWQQQHVSKIDAFSVDSNTSSYTAVRLSQEYRPAAFWLRSINVIFSQYAADSEYRFLDGHRAALKFSGVLNSSMLWRYTVYKDDREDLDGFSYSPLVNEVSWLYQRMISSPDWLITELWYQNQQWSENTDRYSHAYGIRLSYEHSLKQNVKITLNGGYERYREFNSLSFDETTLSIGAGLRYIF